MSRLSRTSTTSSTDNVESRISLRDMLAKDSVLIEQVQEKLIGLQRPDRNGAFDSDDHNASLQLRMRRRMYYLIRLNWYQPFFATLTVVSIVLLAMETNAAAEEVPISSFHRWLNLCLLFAFAVDILLRMFVFCGLFFKSWINIAELALVLFDVGFEVWTGMPSYFTIVKVVRFFRMARVLREFLHLRELYLMCLGLLSSVRAVLFGTVLVICALVIFSILAVLIVRPVAHRLDDEGHFADCIDCRTAFDTVQQSCLTFMSTIVAGDSWGRISAPIIIESTPAGIIVCFAFFAIQLGLVNTIAAVIVDKQVQARSEDQELVALLKAEELVHSVDEICLLFGNVDCDGSGNLSLEELESHYDNNQGFRSLLNRIDIHKAELPLIFEIIDVDQTGEVDYGEFVAGLHNLRNENSHTMAYVTKYYSGSTCRKMDRLEKLVVEVNQKFSLFMKQASLGPESLEAAVRHEPSWSDMKAAFDTLRDTIIGELSSFQHERLCTSSNSQSLVGKAAKDNNGTEVALVKQVLREGAAGKPLDICRDLPLETPTFNSRAPAAVKFGKELSSPARDRWTRDVIPEKV